MHRFFIDPASIQKKHFSSEDDELCHQLSRVLKLHPGEKIVLLDNSEHEYEAELLSIGKTEVKANILKKTFNPDISSISHFPKDPKAPKNPNNLNLFVPPLKNPSRWEWMVEKCTEIGVASFTPLITERTEVKELRKLDRLQRIIREAAEQSGRTKLPVIHDPIELKVFLNNPKDPNNPAFILTLHSSSKPLSSYTLTPKPYNLPAGRHGYNLFLGPVGDFTPAEITQALAKGFLPLSLGSQVLRTETAALVGATLLLHF